MNSERGFTLTELMVACAVIGVVMAGVFALQQQGQFAYLWGAARVEVQQNARLALDLMTRELRSATAVSSCASTSIGFTASDGATAMSYDRAGGSAPYTLTRTVSGATTDVIGGVQSLTIQCFTSDGYTTTTTAASVRSVRIQIQTRVTDTAGAGSMGAQQAVVESRVRLRNL
jgi:prepilin-type N-terminal cleavage/methylation domain-containing protein